MRVKSTASRSATTDATPRPTAAAGFPATPSAIAAAPVIPQITNATHPGRPIHMPAFTSICCPGRECPDGTEALQLKRPMRSRHRKGDIAPLGHELRVGAGRLFLHASAGVAGDQRERGAGAAVSGAQR